MTTKTQAIRLSPSGKKIGNPPLLTGAGSIGRMWRRHGDSTPTALTLVTAIVAVPSLSAITVDIKPGYLYDAQIDYAVTLQSSTIKAEFVAYYRLRNASSSAWGLWVPMANGVHELLGDVTAYSDSGMVQDAAMAISTTVTANAIEFGVVEQTASGALVNPRLAFARIAEYMP